MYKKILVATDASDVGRAAVTEAIRLAKLNKCPLVIVCAIAVNDEFEAVAPELEDRLIERARSHVQQIEAEAKKAGVKAEAEVHSGEPYHVIVDSAIKHNADLIVMGRHGKTALTRLLMGSVTSRVIGHAPCNVLVVK